MMKNIATNFMYDTEKLTDYQLVLCRFDLNSSETVSIGNTLTFNTIKTKSDKFYLTSAAYEEPLTANFQICKDPNSDSKVITSMELSSIMRWLNRKDGYQKFKLYQTGYEDIFFKGSFSNIQAIKVGGEIIGLDLTFTTDSPYGYLDTISLDFTTTPDIDISITNFSYETGHIYPLVFTCKCLADGDLQISNSIENRKTIIKNCKKDEIISLNGTLKSIKSSLANHSLHNDFNFNYFRLGNTYYENLNTITTSLPCEIHIEYNPIRKVGLG